LQVVREDLDRRHNAFFQHPADLKALAALQIVAAGVRPVRQNAVSSALPDIEGLDALVRIVFPETSLEVIAVHIVAKGI
jgi:hypothetical protein